MRKPATILLLALFLVAQYARQVSYWECRLGNYFQSGDNECDCGIIVANGIFDDADPLSPAPVTHHHFDDPYFVNEVLNGDRFLVQGSLSPYSFKHSFLSPGFLASLFRPPNNAHLS